MNQPRFLSVFPCVLLLLVLQQQQVFGLLLPRGTRISIYAQHYHAPYRAISTQQNALAFGELSISEEAPQLSAPLIQSAQERLPWEEPLADDSINSDNDIVSWRSGKQWYITRQRLMDVWVLPRDMSNGSWEAYAAAANRGEESILQKSPQLLRLPSEQIIASAKTVLSVLKLPPALLRKEPLLLTMEPQRLQGGFEQLQANDSYADAAMAREACKNTPGLLLEAAQNWENLNPELAP